MDLTSLLKVQIDFDQSHLFFPSLIHWLILLLLLLITIIHGVPFARSIVSGKRSISFAPGGFDAFRFFGAFGLTVVYVLAMEWIGDQFPNRGLGFLFASIAFMLLLGLLFVHDLNRTKLAIIICNAIAAPTIAWFFLLRLFRITLP